MTPQEAVDRLLELPEKADTPDAWDSHNQMLNGFIYRANEEGLTKWALKMAELRNAINR